MKINKDIIKNLRLIVFIVIVLNLGMAFAEDPPAPPTTINFQGYLTDNAGEAIDGTKDIKIAVYEAATGGSATYVETHSSVTIGNGRFNISIGGGGTVSTGSWPTSADFTRALWLEITIDPSGDNQTLSSRTPLTPAPYAQIAINDSLYSVEKAGCNNSQYVKRNSSDDGWECADLAVTLDGTETLENKTLTTPVITLEQAEDVSGKTEEGKISWDSDDDKLFVGTGSSVLEIGAGGGGASSLSDLSDVGTATATENNILVANGSSEWDGVAVSGDVTMSAGALTIKEDAVTSAKIENGTIENVDISSSAGIEFSKLATLSPAQILVGGWTSVPTAVSPYGDVEISPNGETSISSGVIVDADISSSAAIVTSKLSENISPLSGDTTLDSSHVGVILANGTGSAITLTLPFVGWSNGYKYTIKNVGSNTIIIDTNANNIDGSSDSISLTNQYDYVTLVCNGTEWLKVAENISGEDLGDHTADENIKLGAHYLSNDGGSEGISIDTDGNVTASGSLTIGGSTPATNYTLPSTDGESTQVLKTDGSGNVTWQDDNSGSGGGSYTTYSDGGTGKVTATCTSGNAIMGGCMATTPTEANISQSYPSIGGTVISGSQTPTSWTCYFSDVSSFEDTNGTAYVTCQ